MENYISSCTGSQIDDVVQNWSSVFDSSILKDNDNKDKILNSIKAFGARDQVQHILNSSTDQEGWYTLATFNNFGGGILYLHAVGYWEENLYIFFNVNYTKASITIIGNSHTTKFSKFRIVGTNSSAGDKSPYYLEGYFSPSEYDNNHILSFYKVFESPIGNNVAIGYNLMENLILRESLGDTLHVITSMNHNINCGVETSARIATENISGFSYGESDPPSDKPIGFVYFKKVT